MLLASALQALAVAWPRGETRARPALHIATLHDPSDQATKLDKRESFSKPRERPKFSSPYLKRFGLARARSGPDARDEARTGSVPV